MNIIQYIKGRRKGKEAHHIEWEAMRDPFLTESLEGFDTVTGDHAASIENLQRKIRKKSRRKTSSTAVWAVAASLLLCISIGGYYLLINKQDVQIAYEIKDSTNNTHTIPTPNNDSTQPILDLLAKTETSLADSIPLEIKPKINKPVQTITNRKVADPIPTTNHKSDLLAKLPEKKIVTPVTHNDTQTESSDEKEASISSDQKKDNDVVIISNGSQKRKTTLVGSISSIDITPQSDSILVQGKVLDEFGEALIGASILLENTNKFTHTDINGNFTIKANGEQHAIINYLGFKPDTLSLTANATNVLIKMKPATEGEEMIVVALGTQRAVGILGSVQIIRSEPLIGKKAYRTYLKKNIICPLDSAGKKIKGKVLVEFEVDSTGKPKNFSIKESLCESADKEATRLIKEGPAWSNGTGKVSVTVKF